MTSSAGTSRMRNHQPKPSRTMWKLMNTAKAPWVTRFTSRKGRQFVFQSNRKASRRMPSARSVGRSVARNCSTYPAHTGGTSMVFAVQSRATEDWSTFRSRVSDTHVSPDRVTTKMR